MKKLFAVLGMITCMFALAACGQEADAQMDEFSTNLLQSCESTVENINYIVASGWETQEQYADVYDGLMNWKSSLEDIGSYEGTDGGTVATSEEGYIVSVNVLGSDRDATVEFIIDGSTMYITSFTTNVKYSFGELMKNAAMNTVVGMGTVFVILILISLIISCFNIIPKLQERKKKKAEAKADANAVAADPVVAQIVAKEELSDDTELVAVIAAAIAAYEGSGSTDGFVVRSIRKSSKSKWQNA